MNNKLFYEGQYGSDYEGQDGPIETVYSDGQFDGQIIENPDEMQLGFDPYGFSPDAEQMDYDPNNGYPIDLQLPAQVAREVYMDGGFTMDMESMDNEEHIQLYLDNSNLLLADQNANVASAPSSQSGQPLRIHITQGARRRVNFTAPMAGDFVFVTSSRSAANIDPVAFTAATGQTFVPNGGIGDGGGFSFVRTMFAGQTFSFYVGLWNDARITGWFDLSVILRVPAPPRYFEVTNPSQHNQLRGRQAFDIMWQGTPAFDHHVSMRNLNNDILLINNRPVMRGVNRTPVVLSQLDPGHQYRIAVRASAPGSPDFWVERYFFVQDTASPWFVQMPSRGRGFNAIHAADRRWGTHNTVRSVQAAAGRFSGRGFGPLTILDISFRRGGYMPGHQSHRLGVDVDIRAIRHDGSGGQTNINDGTYSRARTRTLIQDLFATGNIDVIFFNDQALINEFPRVQNYAGHNGHLHVRYFN